jgi:hypothetical protein
MAGHKEQASKSVIRLQNLNPALCTPRTAATCFAVETAVANRRSASASLRACAPPRTPGHRVTDSRRRSELSQLPNVRGAPMVLQEPPAGSPPPSLSRPNGRPFCCPIPSQTTVQAGGFFRTAIPIPKQGFRLSAYSRSPHPPAQHLSGCHSACSPRCRRSGKRDSRLVYRERQ